MIGFDSGSSFESDANCDCVPNPNSGPPFRMGLGESIELTIGGLNDSGNDVGNAGVCLRSRLERFPVGGIPAIDSLAETTKFDRSIPNPSSLVSPRSSLPHPIVAPPSSDGPNSEANNGCTEPSSSPGFRLLVINRVKKLAICHPIQILLPPHRTHRQNIRLPPTITPRQQMDLPQ